MYWLYSMGNVSKIVIEICKMPRLSQGERWQVIDLSSQAGWNRGDLARELQVSQSTVSELIKRHRETDNIKSRPISGRPKVTGQADDSFISKVCRINPLQTQEKLLSNSMPTIVQLLTPNSLVRSPRFQPAHVDKSMTCHLSP